MPIQLRGACFLLETSEMLKKRGNNCKFLHFSFFNFSFKIIFNKLFFFLLSNTEVMRPPGRINLLHHFPFYSIRWSSICCFWINRLSLTVKIQLTAKFSTSRTPKKYTNVQSRVAIKAVTTTKRNQCVDAIYAGDANDMQIMPKTWNLYQD